MVKEFNDVVFGDEYEVIPYRCTSDSQITKLPDRWVSSMGQSKRNLAII